MIESFLNQKVTHKSKSSVDEYNKATYTSKTIKSRFEFKRKLVINQKGEQVVANAKMFTTTKIEPDDVITYNSIDWNAVVVEQIVDLDGNISHYEVAMFNGVI